MQASATDENACKLGHIPFHRGGIYMDERVEVSNGTQKGPWIDIQSGPIARRWDRLVPVANGRGLFAHRGKPG
jgi:hypothetical protein